MATETSTRYLVRLESDDLQAKAIGNRDPYGSATSAYGCIEPDRDSRAAGTAIAELVEAHDYARDAECDPWQFAVEISRLQELGLTYSDLRWLVEKGYAVHEHEVTRSADPAASSPAA